LSIARRHSSPQWFAGFRANVILGQADVMQLPIVKLEQAFSLIPAL
jgi:hypothetical protein